jgi:hypothetical protein
MTGTLLGRAAVRAALWLHKRAPGLYEMRDVLGLKWRSGDAKTGGAFDASV